MLTTAGFDPSSGAGATADLKVFAAHGAFGVSCLTALTVQSTQGVKRVQPVDAALVTDTLHCLADDVTIAGVKIGMLASAEIVRAVVHWLSATRALNSSLPVVLDPVLCASSGRRLLAEDAVAALRDELLPLATILTPNAAEAAVLTGLPVAQPEQIPTAAERLLSMLPADRTGAVIITGGDDSASVVSGLTRDYFRQADAGLWIEGERVETQATHGTGCAYASALLCRLVQGYEPEQAARLAKAYVHDALAAAYPVGKGKGPMHHLFFLDSER